MSKRGLSLEEKRTKVLDILQSSNTCFLLKDIEKLAVKAGVTQQSVKDVIQSLICDDLVSSDKRACCALHASAACIPWTRCADARAVADASPRCATLGRECVRPAAALRLPAAPACTPAV